MGVMHARDIERAKARAKREEGGKYLQLRVNADFVKRKEDQQQRQLKIIAYANTRAACAQVADEFIKTERLMAEGKSKVLWSFVFRSVFGFC